MKQVVQVRLLPTPEASALAETLHACNTAASWLSEQSWVLRCGRVPNEVRPATGKRRRGAPVFLVMHTYRVLWKFDVQEPFYPQLREKFGLAAQPAISVRACWRTCRRRRERVVRV